MFAWHLMIYQLAFKNESIHPLLRVLFLTLIVAVTFDNFIAPSECFPNFLKWKHWFKWYQKKFWYQIFGSIEAIRIDDGACWNLLSSGLSYCPLVVRMGIFIDILLMLSNLKSYISRLRCDDAWMNSMNNLNAIPIVTNTINFTVSTLLSNMQQCSCSFSNAFGINENDNV